MKRIRFCKVVMMTTAAIVGPQVQSQTVTEITKATEAPVDTLGDIVVTAQKRSESVQRSAAAITAVSGETLVNRGFQDIRAAQVLVPSVKFAVQNDSTQIFIRGVGSQLDNPWISESVATHVNGAYIPRMATGGALYDLERIEVLPGPQGTLYGRSAVGGVINIATKRPTSELESDALLEVGNYGLVHATIVHNIPVNDVVSVRGAVNLSRRDGYNDNGTNNESSLSGRLSTLIRPSDVLSVFLWGSYYQNNNRPSPTQFVPFSADGPYHFPDFDAATAVFYPPNGFPLDQSRGEYRAIVAGGQIDWDLDGIGLSYLPGYVHTRGRDDRVIAGFPQPTRTEATQLTNELRLSNSAGSPLNWLVGLYQYWNQTDFLYTFGPNFSGNSIPNHDHSYAGYGQATYSVTDAVRVTAGGRYSWEKIDTTGAEAYFPTFPGFGRGVATFDFEQSWKHFDWKAGIELDVGARSLLYANVQTGFNPGSYQTNVPTQGQTINSQKMIAYTVGSKNRFLDNRLQANVELYYYRYQDMIIQAYDLSIGAFRVFNAPRTRMYGAQLDLVYAVSNSTRFNLNGGYLNAKFSRFSAGTMAGIVQDYSGYTLPFSAEWTISGGAEHRFDLASGASVKLRADTHYESGYWDTFTHQPDLRQGAYTKTDVSLTYYSADGSWDVGLWAKNLENEATHAAAGETGNPRPFAGAVYVEAPRTFGIRLHANFHR